MKSLRKECVLTFRWVSISINGNVRLFVRSFVSLSVWNNFKICQLGSKNSLRFIIDINHGKPTLEFLKVAYTYGMSKSEQFLKT